MTEWKTHPKFVNYEFSSNGDVRSTFDGRVRYLRGSTSDRGYKSVSLSSNKLVVKREYIHRAVCELFNGPQPAWSQCCRHLDGDKTNNAASNIAWGTDKENEADKALHGTSPKGEKNPMAILTREKVEQMRSIRASENKPYYKIAKDFGVSTMTAFKAVTLRAWK